MKNIYSISLVLALVLFTSCLKNGLNKNVNVAEGNDNSFIFETVKESKINLDLGLNGISILVEFYGENPYETIERDGYSYLNKKEGLEPIHRAITDDNGKLTDIISFPTDIKTIYLVPNFISLPAVIPIEVTNSEIIYSVNDKSTPTKTRSTRASYNYPNNFKVFGNWNQYGLPEYLNSVRTSYPAKALYNLNKIITGQENTFKGSQFLKEEYNNNLTIVKSTGIKLSFLYSNASMLNTICYYTYPTGQKPTDPKDIQLIVAFPNTTSYNSVDRYFALSYGDNVSLKYWNKEKNQFEDTFPAGITVSFVIMPNSFKNGNISAFTSIGSNGYWFSQDELNTTENFIKRHCILLFDSENDIFTYAFEDRPTWSNSLNKAEQYNYSDAVCYIKSDVPDAISSENVGELSNENIADTSEDNNFITKTGTLIFEDLWPSEGDYDMNDLVVEYKCTVYRNKSNRITKLVDEFKTKNIGGSINSAFGYNFGISEIQFAGCEITPALDASSVFKMGRKGFEKSQTSTTVIVFDKVTGNAVYNVKTLLSSPQEYKGYMIPPYNPFIVVAPSEANVNSRKEVHLTNYPPTSLANMALFGTQNDKSNPERNEYYFSSNRNFPFAMNIPIVDFKYTTETVRIDREFPDFNLWVSSKGTEGLNWYENKK